MARTQRIMAEDDFWALIDVLDGQVDDEALARLDEALRARGSAEARAFQERLSAVLFELDREVLARQPVRWTDDDPDDLIPLSDDTFLYLRAAVVARGRGVWAEVLADPAAVTRYVWEDGEGLLYVAEEVVGDDVDTEFCYETGSNADHWPERPGEPMPWGEGPCPVWVEVWDLAQPVAVESVSFDVDGSESGSETTLEYSSPEYLRHDLSWDLSVLLARILQDGGGLPAEVGAPRIEVTVEVGETWRLQPEVADPVAAADPIADGELVRPVRLAVPDVHLRSLSRADRETAVAALGAAGVLAVLPEGHPAGAALREVQAEGAEQLSA